MGRQNTVQDIDFIGVIRGWEIPGIAPPAKKYRDLPFLRADDRPAATTADYAKSFRVAVVRSTSTATIGGVLCAAVQHRRRRRAGRWPMIVRADQMVANCTAGGAQAADVRHGERPIGRTDQSPSFACLASHRPSKRQACTRKDQSRLFRRDE